MAITSIRKGSPRFFADTEVWEIEVWEGGNLVDFTAVASLAFAKAVTAEFAALPDDRPASARLTTAVANASDRK